MLRVAGILFTPGIVAGLLVAVLRVTGETSSETCWRAHLNPKVDRVLEKTDISSSRVFLMDGESAMAWVSDDLETAVGILNLLS
jgi:ABC-type phosphate transport system permease subunit